MCLALGPYLLSSYLKKKKLVSAASYSCGFFRASMTRLSLSSRLSRPRHKALEILSSHFGPVLDCTDNMSNDTLKSEKIKFLIFGQVKCLIINDYCKNLSSPSLEYATIMIIKNWNSLVADRYYYHVTYEVDSLCHMFPKVSSVCQPFRTEMFETFSHLCVCR